MTKLQQSRMEETVEMPHVQFMTWSEAREYDDFPWTTHIAFAFSRVEMLSAANLKHGYVVVSMSELEPFLKNLSSVSIVELGAKLALALKVRHSHLSFP